MGMQETETNMGDMSTHVIRHGDCRSSKKKRGLKVSDRGHVKEGSSAHVFILFDLFS